MDGGDDDTGVFAIEEGDAETLIASDLLEWIETDDFCFVDALETEFVETIGNLEELLDLLVEYLHVFLLLDEDFFEFFSIFPAEENIELLLEGRASFPEDEKSGEQENFDGNDERHADPLSGRKSSESRKIHSAESESRLKSFESFSHRTMDLCFCKAEHEIF
jgi:hypothetical protein